MRPAILIVDDDLAHRTMLETMVKSWAYEPHTADDGDTALAAVEKRAYDLILMDIRMVRMSGIEALDAIQKVNPAIPIVLMTAYASVDTAVEALKKGAYDYLTKPLDFEKLKITLIRAMEHVRLKDENYRLKAQAGELFDSRNIVGKSPAMRQLLETLTQAAPAEATVLVTGESGTGKELVAGAIHYNSPRRNGPFVKINCAAITETLLESELFGHERGSFTGADRRKEGRLVQAQGGTLFLDEISSMPMSMQAKLLRVLQERELTRVGGEDVIRLDVRVVAATNIPLEDMVKEGSFREDLYYRLNVVTLKLPALRERREDIPLLADRFLKDFSEKNRKDIKGFSPQAMDRMLRHGWPGNVRELMNSIERAVVLSTGAYLEAGLMLPDFFDEQPLPPIIEPEAILPLEEVEKTTIIRTLHALNGNKSETARQLGITRKTLHKKLKSYGLMPESSG
ncbi:sigma-54-dependent transcriptional regulator [Desulfobotulus mexicanus]|uniref:Sigma-54-dependent Fis family transcriptional regulator n=1 Tax=Desulfobotulus mexicanus TaxID=2586642 RepID=A0A5Q4VGE9_9BACT|nr:sigma-54 dependent transcriptional regulator [Desulfobotulus mexicanus]TYT76023.1 sigma-54-dependent Fis family transcriptional regulator [Desulfobotulus mexicanus]